MIGYGPVRSVAAAPVWAGAAALFLSGCKARADREGPQRQVTISPGLYVGRYEVTQGEWEAVMGANPSHFRAAGADAPVERVSWDDCQEFLSAA